MPAAQLDQFAFHAADVAQPQDRAATDRAAFGFDRIARPRGDVHREAAAFRAQHFDRLLDLLGFSGLEPGTEGQHALLGRARHDELGIAENFRHVGAGGPGDEHLRLRHQQSFQSVAFGLQGADFVARESRRLAGKAARAQEDDDREHAEQQVRGSA